MAKIEPATAQQVSEIRLPENYTQVTGIYTTSTINAETVAHIQRDHLLDQQNFHDLIDYILQPQKWISLIAVDDDMLTQALRKVKERNDRRFSLVDATNIELMQKHQIDF